MIRVGIAGFGKIGQIRYNELKKYKNIEVVGFYDPNVKYEKSNLERFDSFDSLIDSNINTIFLCLYPKFLSDYTIKALKKNIHVF